jgi:hypothetical protein
MERERGSDPLPFGEAIRIEAERSRDALPLQNRLYSYVDRGYSDQLRRIWRYFPVEQTLVLKARSCSKRPRLRWRASPISSASPDSPRAPRSVHARPYQGPMSAEARRYLGDVFEFEIRSLERTFDGIAPNGSRRGLKADERAQGPRRLWESQARGDRPRSRGIQA